MDPLAGASRWMPKKLIVLDQSLSKIEAGTIFNPSLPPSLLLFFLLCTLSLHSLRVALEDVLTRNDGCTFHSTASYTLSIRTAEYADQPEMLKMFQDRLLREGIPIEQPQETVFVA